MINLNIKTEFHFSFSDRGYGRIEAIAERIKAMGGGAAGIMDAGTWGHIQWFTTCKKIGIKPILGALVQVPTEDAIAKVGLIARNDTGLRELYHLTSAATAQQITVDDIITSSKDVIKLTGTLPRLSKAQNAKLKKSGAYADVSPSMPEDLLEIKRASGLPLLATSDNRYPTIADRSAFSLFGGSPEGHPQHILTEREARAFMKWLPDSAFSISDKIAKDCNIATPPKARNMEVDGDIEAICRAAIKRRVKRWTPVYEERLKLELLRITERNFTSYFLIISDLVRYAKKHMIVGPGRGSAAGSLVCYLLDITDVDPIVHGLLFERFIDVTREDLPDIDLDFPDAKRSIVIEYLRKRYGEDNVVHIGSILTLQPKSIIRLVSKRLDIKLWEFQQLLDVMIERASGDSRGSLCLLDTLEGMEEGKKVLARFPQLRTATAFEGHAQATGTHAAGIVVCAEPVKQFCTVDPRTFTAQIDKHDAESINLLKIDILGLRTLSVIEYTLEQIPKAKRPDLNKIPLDDEKAFAIFNDQRWAGIFQFEGDALQMLQKTIKVGAFTDICALTALARPGPLNSGGGQEWCDRKMGRSSRLQLHPMCNEFTDETHGIIIYQEQVMSIARKVGLLGWDDVMEIRKTMAKSKGEEHFSQFWIKFQAGAISQGISKEDASTIWGSLVTMGTWCFNKSHAVSYGLLSYWCAWLKAHFPLEFACATLRHTKGEEQTIDLLRELSDEGIDYTAFDPETSVENWKVIDGRLTGGFLNLKGVGETTAAELVESRAKGWTEKQRKKVADAEVLYDDIYPARRRYGKLYADPKGCGFHAIRKLWTMRELDVAKTKGELPSEFYFLGRLFRKVPRDLNEYIFQVKRVQEGRPKMLTKESAYLNVIMDDDTGRISMTISAPVYEEVGRSITETGVAGKSWYLMRGRFNRLGRINVTWSKDITEMTWA